MGNLGNKDAVPKNLDEVDKIGQDQKYVLDYFSLDCIQLVAQKK